MLGDLKHDTTTGYDPATYTAKSSTCGEFHGQENRCKTSDLPCLETKSCLSVGTDVQNLGHWSSSGWQILADLISHGAARITYLGDVVPA